MKKAKLFFVLLSIFIIAGCGTKKEASTQLDETQDALNQTVSTQTELTRMQDEKSVVISQETAVDAASPVLDESGLQDAASPSNQEIQQALANANLYQGKIDGDLGPKTKKAIKDFQEQSGLKVDGKVGPRTWAKLQPYLNQPPQTTATEE